MAKLKEIEELTTFTEKLFLYKFNLSFAYSFFAFSSIFTGGLLLLIATGAIGNPYLLVIGIIVCMIAGIIVLNTVFMDALKKVEAGRMEGPYWFFSFCIPFFAYYAAASFLNLPDVYFAGLIWYLSLGTALILVAILIENRYVTMRKLFARPFLMAGTLVILTSPLVFLIEGFSFKYSSSLLALGLMLLAYFISGSYALIQAEKVFAAKIAER